MMTIEVKIEGLNTAQKDATYSVIWLDWDRFQFVPAASHGAMNRRRVVTDGHQAFQILIGKTKLKFLQAQGSRLFKVSSGRLCACLGTEARYDNLRVREGKGCDCAWH